MARGKHAARATRRANEAAIAHIDRLTEKVTDAKVKARQFESAAKELPAARVELARLRKQLEDGTSDSLERERLRRQEQAVEFEKRVFDIGHLIADVIDLNREVVDYEIPEDFWIRFTELVGPLDAFFVGMGTTRNGRRNLAKSASELKGVLQRSYEVENHYWGQAQGMDKRVVVHK